MPAETHVERSPIGPDEVLRMIRERLAEILEIDESRITLDSKFTDDLDADSLALIELVEALEEELGERTVGFTFDDEDLADLHTVARRGRLRRGPARLGRGAGRWIRMSPQVARAADPDLDARLQLALGWTFRDHALLDLALTHRSYCAERGIEASNERLEFLGDSVLGFVVTTFVYDEYPAAPRGRARQAARGGRELGDARPTSPNEIDLGAALRLGKGEDASGGRAKSSILADAMEAVIAAVYLDGGLDAARPRDPRGAREPRSASRPPVPAAATTRRACRSSRRSSSTSSRATRSATRAPTTPSASSPPCCSRGEVYGTGEGRSKKAAEQAAAREAWERLQLGVSRRRPPREWAMPELPEVEVVRRDLEKRGRRQEDQERRGRRHARGAAPPQPQAVREPARRQEDHRRRAAREVPPLPARRRRRARDPPRHVGPAAAQRRPHASRWRSTPTW